MYKRKRKRFFTALDDVKSNLNNLNNFNNFTTLKIEKLIDFFEFRTEQLSIRYFYLKAIIKKTKILKQK